MTQKELPLFDTEPYLKILNWVKDLFMIPCVLLMALMKGIHAFFIEFGSELSRGLKGDE